jgi:hypothetical protein
VALHMPGKTGNCWTSRGEGTVRFASPDVVVKKGLEISPQSPVDRVYWHCRPAAIATGLYQRRANESAHYMLRQS